MDERPDWDHTWLAMAESVKLRSRCSRDQIGCVLVSSDNQVVSASYNGPPPGFVVEEPTCRDWCPRATAKTLDPAYRDCVSSHAEMSAVARADFSRLAGGTAYVTGSICFQCAKLLATSGVARVVVVIDSTREAHRKPTESLKFMKDCGLELSIWPKHSRDEESFT